MDEALRAGAHYNFATMHLISQYAGQILRFPTLGQYSTDISQSMHKGFKDAYRRSNKVDSTSQIVNTYMRDHTFAMKDLTIDICKRIRQDCATVDVRNQSTNRQTYLKLQEKIYIGRVSNP